MQTSPREPVYLEVGSRRVFACSLAWPGWCRAATDEAAAIEALGAYRRRYAAVADEAGVPFPPAEGDAPADELFTVAERLTGSATTDFGAPSAIPDADAAPLDTGEANHLADLVAAAWRVFDAVVLAAPATLGAGPRGGGRDRDEIIKHVAEAERSYARKLGVRASPREFAAPGGHEALRVGVLDALRDARAGEPGVEGGWPARYAARRIAWHALDHAWEIEDRSG